MNNTLRKTLPVIAFVILIASCSKAETIQASPTEERQSTPAVVPSVTISSAVAITSTPLVTPYQTTPAQATIETFSSLCIGAKKILESEISPNGQWIAAICYWENGKEESPLHVVSIDHSREWKIYYRDYGKSHSGDRHDAIMPYRWSKDQKFLYAVAGSRLSGCCWIGGKYVLLVRLDLETGEQTEIINGTDFGSDLPFSFTISENDHFLLSTPLTNQPYDFAVSDLLSGESRVIKLEEPKPINLEFAVMSPFEDIIVLPLFKNIEYNDYEVESLALVDLKLNEQSVLVSNLEASEELYPIRWIDEEHVLVSSANPSATHYFNEPPIEYWSLDTNTGERKIVDNP
jgi:hypothetical protein